MNRVEITRLDLKVRRGVRSVVNVACVAQFRWSNPIGRCIMIK